jgi:hypothetical protein
MKHVFSCNTNPAMSSQGTRARARTNEWKMTVEHALNCLCNELRCSDNKIGYLDDGMQNDSLVNCSQGGVATVRRASKPINVFDLPLILTYNLQSPQHSHHTSAAALHHLWPYIQYSRCLFGITTIQYPAGTHWQPLRAKYITWCLLVAEFSGQR